MSQLEGRLFYAHNHSHKSYDVLNRPLGAVV